MINREKAKEAKRKSYMKHKDRYLSEDRARQARIRNSILDLFGRLCSKCGFTDIRALQVDHIKGGGTQESKRGPVTMYRRILTDPSGYQLLCANCNWIKRAENKEYPNSRARRANK